MTQGVRRRFENGPSFFYRVVAAVLAVGAARLGWVICVAAWTAFTSPAEEPSAGLHLLHSKVGGALLLLVALLSWLVALTATAVAGARDQTVIDTRRGRAARAVGFLVPFFSRPWAIDEIAWIELEADTGNITDPTYALYLYRGRHKPRRMLVSQGIRGRAKAVALAHELEKLLGRQVRTGSREE